MKVLLNENCIEALDYPLYDICWSLYEFAKERPDRKQEYQQWWKKIFPIVYQLVDFCGKEKAVVFYGKRKEKYLQTEMRIFRQSI